MVIDTSFGKLRVDGCPPTNPEELGEFQIYRELMALEAFNNGMGMPVIMVRKLELRKRLITVLTARVKKQEERIATGKFQGAD